jgi:MoxR-like ATPase
MEEKKDIIQEYLQFFEQLKSKYVEREWELEQIKYALLIKEHVLLLGGPGLAKSQMAKEVLNALEGAKIYTNQFSADQDPSYVFGPQSLNEFKKGIIKHNTEGSLVQADYAFLDEFFNASTETINSALEILNERTFTRLHQKEVSPLCSAILTTNQHREGEEELAAIYDRILFISEVQPIKEKNNRVSMYKDFLHYIPKTAFNFSMESMCVLYKSFSKQFEYSDTFLDLYDLFLSEFVAQTGVYISDRKKNKLLTLVCASAFFRNAVSLEEDDIKILKYALVRGKKMEATFDLVFGRARKEIALYQDLDEDYRALEKILNHEGPDGEELTDLQQLNCLRGMLNFLEAKPCEKGTIYGTRLIALRDEVNTEIKNCELQVGVA